VLLVQLVLRGEKASTTTIIPVAFAVLVEPPRKEDPRTATETTVNRILWHTAVEFEAVIIAYCTEIVSV